MPHLNLDTRSHFAITNACGLDNNTYLLLFGDQPRTSTYGTVGPRDGTNLSIHIRRVLAAVNACHGLLQAIDACHRWSPLSENNLITFRFHYVFPFIVWIADHVYSVFALRNTLADKSTPSPAYLAVKACHGLFCASNACQVLWLAA
eukprot:6193748-Pleurochrysis_carterae.AAC.1